MKILFLYTYNQGYLSKFFLECSASLVRDGHQVKNFCLKRESLLMNEEGVDIQIEKKGGYLKNYFKVFKTIKNYKPDVIISNFSYVNPSLLFGRLLGVKKNIAWFHSLKDQINPSKRQIIVKTWFLKKANIMIANSFLTSEELQIVYGVPKSRISVLPFWSNIGDDGYDNEDSYLKSPSEIIKIGCPGRLVKHKNQDLVIDSFKVLLEKEYSVHLYIAGDGEDRIKLSNKTLSLGIEKNISFLGNLHSHEMIDFYKDMDIIVLPSLNEAFGLVLIEALSMGKPVLVSSSFGALGFMDLKESFLKEMVFNPRSREDLTSKLIGFINSWTYNKTYFRNLSLLYFKQELIYKSFKKIVES